MALMVLQKVKNTEGFTGYSVVEPGSEVVSRDGTVTVEYVGNVRSSGYAYYFDVRYDGQILVVSNKEFDVVVTDDA